MVRVTKLILSAHFNTITKSEMISKYMLVLKTTALTKTNIRQNFSNGLVQVTWVSITTGYWLVVLSCDIAKEGRTIKMPSS